MAKDGKTAKKKTARKRKKSTGKKTARKTVKKKAAKDPVKITLDQQTVWIIGLIAVIVIGAVLFKGAEPDSTAPARAGGAPKSTATARTTPVQNPQAQLGSVACTRNSDCPQKTGKTATCTSPGRANAECTYSDAVKVDVIVLNDKKCASCDTSGIMQTTKGFFPGLVVKNVDVSSEEGKKLVEEHGIKMAPAYIFDDKVTETNTWKTNPNIEKFFKKSGDQYKLDDKISGASFLLNEEARGAYNKAIGLTSGDNKPQIDFFLMSYCTYGNQAEEQIKAVRDSLGDSVEYNPHYVIYENYGGGGPAYCIEGGKYCSMHGIQELNQDIREACVDKYLGIDAYFDFVTAINDECNSRNSDACWEAVAEKLGLDTGKIKECEKNEKVSIAAAEKKLNNILNVEGSPTVFIEGEKYAGPRSALGYQTALCGKFDKKPPACKNIQSTA